MITRFNIFFALAALFLAVMGAPTANAQSFSSGTDFQVAIPCNYSGLSDNAEIRIISSTTTSGTITSATGINQPFTVSPGTPYYYLVPASQAITAHAVIENKGLRITSGAPVSVYVGSSALDGGSGDATVAIPTANCGQDFRVTSYYSLFNSRILIVATANNTTVTITPICGTSANVPFNVTLNAGQTYMWTQACQLTGSRVQSNLPIQVFGTSECSQVPNGSSYCDFLMATALPISRWGTTYVTAPLAGRNNTDYFLVVAHNANTNVYRNGVLQGTLAAGGNLALTMSGGNVITANQPIHVTQFARSNSLSGSFGDPAQAHLFPTNMFYTSYRFSSLLTNISSSHYVTVISRTAGAASVRLNGSPMTFTAFGSGWSYAQSVVGAGVHTVTGDSLCHAVVHGWDGVNSYATPVGASIPVVVLPIGDVQLHGEALAEGNLLEWECPADLAEGHFELLRALDPSAPQSLAIQEAPSAQRYVDAGVHEGQTWLYRLRHYTPDGDVTESDWVSILSKGRPAALRIAPNPVREDLNLVMALDAHGPAIFRILDLQGREVSIREAQISEGESQFALVGAGKDLPAGSYILELSIAGQKHTCPFTRAE